MLLLRLSSCGGSFQIQTALESYKVTESFLPMIYSVDLIRMTISGINQARFIRYIMLINLFIILFIYLGLISSIIRS